MGKSLQRITIKKPKSSHKAHTWSNNCFGSNIKQEQILVWSALDIEQRAVEQCHQKSTSLPLLRCHYVSVCVWYYFFQTKYLLKVQHLLSIINWIWEACNRNTHFLKTKAIDFLFRQFVKNFPSWRLGGLEQEAIQSKAHGWAHFRSVHMMHCIWGLMQCETSIVFISE